MSRSRNSRNQALVTRTITLWITSVDVSLVSPLWSPAIRTHKAKSDGYQMRRSCVDFGIPLLTNSKVALLFISSLYQQREQMKSGWDVFPIDPREFYLRYLENCSVCVCV